MLDPSNIDSVAVPEREKSAQSFQTSDYTTPSPVQVSTQISNSSISPGSTWTSYRETGIIVIKKPRKPTNKDSEASIFSKRTSSPDIVPLDPASKDKTTLDRQDTKNPKKAEKTLTGWKEVGAAKVEPLKAQMNMLEQILNTLDPTEMWRNCIGFFVLMYLTYLLTWLGFGFFGFLIASSFGAQWYYNSITRFRRAARDDIARGFEKDRLVNNGESAAWMNEFLSRFWVFYEPVLCATVVQVAEGILDQQTPAFLDSLKLSTFTLGSKAPRIERIQTHTDVESRDLIVMDWETSFNPNDISDLPKALLAERVNPKVVLSVRVGKGFVGAALPILVEDMVFKGKLQIRLRLSKQFPPVKTAEVSFIEKPTIDFVLKPVGGNTFGLDIAHIPGLSDFIMTIVHSTMAPMFYAPNFFSLDIDSLINGSVAKVDGACGVAIINIINARNLPKADTFGTADPYVVISSETKPDISARTNRKEGTLSPTWNETFALIIPAESDKIMFNLWDWNAVGKDEKMCNSFINMEQLIEQGGRMETCLALKKQNKNAGELNLSISYFPVHKDPVKKVNEDPELKIELEDQSETKKATEGDSSTNKTENPEADPAKEELVEDPDELIESDSGLLQLYVRSARDMAPDEASSKKFNLSAAAYLDSKVIIECPEFKKSDCPVWELGKEVFVASKTASFITINLKNSGRSIANVKFNLHEMIAKRNEDAANQVQGSDWIPVPNSPKGHVRVEVIWRPIIMDVDTVSSLIDTRSVLLPPLGIVKLNIKEAKNLKSSDAIQTSNSIDPYVKVQALNKVLAQTMYIDNTSNPTWNETLFVPVTNMKQSLLLECLNFNKNGKHKPIGDVFLPISQLLGETLKDNDLTTSYEKISPKEIITQLRLLNGKVRGELSYRAEFIPLINFNVNNNATQELKKESESSLRNSKIPSLLVKKDSDKSYDANKSPKEKPSFDRSSSAVPNQRSLPESSSKSSEELKEFEKFSLLPSIDYSEFKSGVISLVILSVRNLSRAYSGVSISTTLNNNVDLIIGKTKPSRRSGNAHDWDNENFQFVSPEIDLDKIKLEVNTLIPGQSNSLYIGKADYSVKNLIRGGYVNTKNPVWIPLNEKNGEILCKIRFDPTEDPQITPEESLSNNGILNLHVVSASNLPAADSRGSSDPYAVLSVNGTKIWKTETIKKNCNPNWNEKTTINIVNRRWVNLTFDVFDWNQIQSDERLGGSSIQLSDIPINEVVQRKLYFMGSSQESGSPYITISFMFTPSYLSQSSDNGSSLKAVVSSVAGAPVTIIKGGTKMVGGLLGSGATFVAGGGAKVVGGGAKIVGGGAKFVGGGAKIVGGGALSAGSSAVKAVGGVFGFRSKKQSVDDSNRNSLESRKTIDPQLNLSPLRPNTLLETPTISPIIIDQNKINNNDLQPSPKLQSPTVSRKNYKSNQGIAEYSLNITDLTNFPRPGILNIGINEANLLDGKDRALFTRVSMNMKNLFKTKTEKKSQKAVWKETFSVPILAGSNPILEFALKEYSRFGENKTLFLESVDPLNELKSQLVSNDYTFSDVKVIKLSNQCSDLIITLEYKVNMDSTVENVSSQDSINNTFDTQSTTKHTGSDRKSIHSLASSIRNFKKIVDSATRRLAKCGKSAAMVRLRQELSLTDLNIKTAVARTLFCTFVTSNVQNVIPSAAAELPFLSKKRTRLEYSTVAKKGLIDPVTKNNYNFALKSKNNTKNQIRPTIYKEISVKYFLDDSALTKLKKCALTFDVYQTVNYDKGVTIVKIQKFFDVAMNNIVASLNKNVSPIDTITDIGALEDTKAGCYKPYNMKLMFKKSDPQAEFPNLLEFINIVVPITYNGCKPLFHKPKTEKTAKKSSKNKSKQAELYSTKMMQKKINNFFGIRGKNQTQTDLYANKIINTKSEIFTSKSQKPNKLQAENSENKKPIIKLLAGVPGIKNQNIYAESEAAKKNILSKKKLHIEITMELSDQNNLFDSSCPPTPNFKKKCGESDRYEASNIYSANYISMDLVGKLANNNSIADLEMQ
ncbi:hypothetical protein BB561_003292 [Smittium simulii]|uniref:Uncharacterized protein n=1 Tax=Smittium simulii TaxID=133385 RepID=A0A2T9YM68_9FUNG|nr:hypothetical protein BB561_003292 [Smittium simulii]